jgi:hypothetical protein
MGKKEESDARGSPIGKNDSFFYEDGRGYKKLTVRLRLFVKEPKSRQMTEVGRRHYRSSSQMVDQR